MAQCSCHATALDGRLPEEALTLTKGRDFERTYQFVDCAGTPNPAKGALLLEVDGVRFPFTMMGSLAHLKVKFNIVDQWRLGARWQIFFLPQGDSDGGQPVARGSVRRQQ
jgi:hypothetical protein